jgi:hypothetical protein
MSRLLLQAPLRPRAAGPFGNFCPSIQWTVLLHGFCHGDRVEFDPSPPSRRSFLNPKSSPTFPVGFGMGHSLRDFLPLVCSPITSSPSREAVSSRSTALELSLAGSSVLGFRRLLRLIVPSTGISPSAYAILGAGQGNICGIPTTKKLAKRVVTNRDEVSRDRGCRCGGMMNSLRARSRYRPSIES